MKIFREIQRELVEERLPNDKNGCRSEWFQSMVVGCKTFVEGVKEQLGILKGRKVID